MLVRPVQNKALFKSLRTWADSGNTFKNVIKGTAASITLKDIP